MIYAFQIEKGVPVELLISFSACTALLIGVHILALMISTCILPHLEALGSMYNDTFVQESPDEKMYWYINAAWVLSTGCGIVLFLVVIALQCWVKFFTLS